MEHFLQVLMWNSWIASQVSISNVPFPQTKPSNRDMLLHSRVILCKYWWAANTDSFCYVRKILSSFLISKQVLKTWLLGVGNLTLGLKKTFLALLNWAYSSLSFFLGGWAMIQNCSRPWGMYFIQRLLLISFLKTSKALCLPSFLS